MCVPFLTLLRFCCVFVLSTEGYDLRRSASSLLQTILARIKCSCCLFAVAVVVLVFVDEMLCDDCEM